MRPSRLLGLAFSVVVALVGAIQPSIASASAVVPWQTGMVAVGNGTTVEPAVSDTDGSQVFLMTPNHSPFYDGSANPSAPLPASFNQASAPLYLVTYPLGSTVDAGAPLNCYTAGFFTSGLPYNCNHAQIPGIKGHDHLLGVPASAKSGGDFNVQWHVLATFFTPKGMTDGAMNTRILTLAQLQSAQALGDVTGFVDTHIYFNCSVVSSASYLVGTPLRF
ncbi:MAG: hypothetical protein HY829_04895 [Actinobacteria bacterium]|nr:hypothetical protein [Actinomycetota bacterium]